MSSADSGQFIYSKQHQRYCLYIIWQNYLNPAALAAENCYKANWHRLSMGGLLLHLSNTQWVWVEPHQVHRHRPPNNGQSINFILLVVPLIFVKDMFQVLDLEG